MGRETEFEALIVGAGISGIGAAHYLQTLCPGTRYAMLEARERLGGTWDLFRYPGVRSDSDMYTLGYAFRPWTDPKAIADGPSILRYLEDTAEEEGIAPNIQYGVRVERLSWSTERARWTVEARVGNERVVYHCSFLFMCAGYYRYDAGYTPDFEGIGEFRGEVVHPQQWTDDVDYAGKRVVVIGSGATAMTLVPELAKEASRVTMLQRSPTYVLSAPSEDRIANWLRGRVPGRAAYALARWKNVLFGMAFYGASRRFPLRVKRWLVGSVREALGDDFDVERHFTPRYNPWDQRVCLVPEGDLFDAIRAGRVDVVTDHIERFTESGLALRSGAQLEADLVVTATGLQLQFLGGASLTVDGREVVPAETMTYRGMMLSGVPNLMFAVGYTNASWTLKVDLTCEYACRLLRHMKDEGYDYCVPRRDASVREEPLLDFSSGYIQRSIDEFPRGGDRQPWKLYQNYALDMLALRHRSLDDGSMEFARARSRVRDRALQPRSAT